MTERRQAPRGAAERRAPLPARDTRRTTEESGEFLRPDLAASTPAKTVRIAPAPPAQYVPRRFS
ncbi:MAG TPA: hypothetical protein VLT33_01645, partial [Labilithrix sp.]|nr:hypothetical protein [Labilithrix sp.]